MKKIFHKEKLGGPRKSQSVIDNFREAFIDVGLFDLCYSRYDYTWSNFQELGVVVEERHDRFCADTDWSLLFPTASITHVDFDMSFHLPILLKCSLVMSPIATGHASSTLRICSSLILPAVALLLLFGRPHSSITL